MRDYEPLEYEYQRYTFEELRAYVKQQWRDMSSEEKSMRVQEVNPTYAEYVLGLVSPGEVVDMDDFLYDHKIVESNSVSL